MNSKPEKTASWGDFLTEDLWQVDLSTQSPFKALLIKTGRTILMSLSKFVRDECPQRASALTFYCLLSVVPVAAMAFGVAKGFGFQDTLEKELLERFAAQADVVNHVIGFAKTMLDSTQGGLIAGIGLVVLFWSVIKVLSHIEHSFNIIWEFPKGRTWVRKFTDYLAMMLIAPVLFLLSSSATIFVTTQITRITEQIALLGAFAPLISGGLKILPYLLIWLLFSVIYLLMPNGRVRFLPALTGGVIAGTIFQIVQWGYIHFQVGIAKYNAIYGSFAALPLFLIWLQLSWLIVLLGAEIASSMQRIANNETLLTQNPVSPRLRQHLALKIMRLIIDRFRDGKAALAADEIATHLRTPLGITHEIVDQLARGGLLVELEADLTPTFAPAQDPERITVNRVLNVLEQDGLNQLPLAETVADTSLDELMDRMDQERQDSQYNQPLHKIVL